MEDLNNLVWGTTSSSSSSSSTSSKPKSKDAFSSLVDFSDHSSPRTPSPSVATDSISVSAARSFWAKQEASAKKDGSPSLGKPLPPETKVSPVTRGTSPHGAPTSLHTTPLTPQRASSPLMTPKSVPSPPSSSSKSSNRATQGSGLTQGGGHLFSDLLHPAGISSASTGSPTLNQMAGKGSGYESASPAGSGSTTGGGADPWDFDHLLSATSKEKSSTPSRSPLASPSPPVSSSSISSSTSFSSSSSTSPSVLTSTTASGNHATSQMGGTTQTDDDPFGLGIPSLSVPFMTKKTGVSRTVNETKRKEEEEGARGNGEEEDNPLGILGQPVERARSPQRPPPPSSKPPPPRRSPSPAVPPASSSAIREETPPRRKKQTSPPPPPADTSTERDEALARLVDMGFSDVQARRALLECQGDVEVAIAWLIQRNSSPKPKEKEREGGEGGGWVGQASSIGASVLGRASTLFSQGKEYVSKAMDNQGLEDKSGGRPRWRMNEEEEEEEEEEEDGMERQGYTRFTRYKDDDVDGDVISSSSSEEDEEEEGPIRIEEEYEEVRRRQRQLRQEEREGKTKGSEGSRGYAGSRKASPFSPTPPPQASQHRASPPPARRAPPAPPTTGPMLPPHLRVRAQAEEITRAKEARMRGNEHFKMGRYGEAVAQYTLGLSALPGGHAHRIRLWNNRAASRAQQGEYAAAIEDAEAVLSLIGTGGWAMGDVRVTGLEGTGMGAGEKDTFSLQEQGGKAISRKAGSLEALERWEEAGREWRSWVERSDIGDRVRTQCVQGARRCEDMVRRKRTQEQEKREEEALRRRRQEEEEAAAAAAAASTRSHSTPTTNPFQFDDAFNLGGMSTTSSFSSASSTPTDVSKSKRVQEMRKAEAKAAMEAEQRWRVKDTVEARIGMWRLGKDGNLRALLATMDGLLWPELGLKPVGINDLIQPGQVKKAYVRAIARLHPDKVSKSATMEQQLVASELFVTLNGAWDVFKAQHGMG